MKLDGGQSPLLHIYDTLVSQKQQISMLKSNRGPYLRWILIKKWVKSDIGWS